MAATLSMENELFSKFMFYAGLLLLKTIVMSVLTIKNRLGKNIFLNPEDYKMNGTKPAASEDSGIERIRRAHRNDLENILPFVLIGLLYVWSGPGTFWATLHFRVFAGARILHTVCYLNSLQPGRFILFTIGFAINVSMAVQVLMSTSPF